MSTERRLWLGFGTLLVILVLTVSGVLVWLRSMSGSLQDILKRGEPARQAVYEMDVHNSSTGLGVLNYLHTRAAGYRQRVADDAAQFRSAAEQYRRLTPSREDLAQQISAVFEEYVLLGMKLMDQGDKEAERHDALSAGLKPTLRDLDEHLKADLAADRRAGARNIDALLGVRQNLAAAGIWLGLYRRTLNPDDHHAFVEAERDTHIALGRYSALPLAEDEREWAQQVGDRIGTNLEQMAAAAAAIDDEQQDLQRFFYMRLRLDTLLHEGALKAANEDLAVSGAAVRAAANSILGSTVLLLVAAIAVSIATGLLVSRAIVRTERLLRVTLASIGDAVIAADPLGRITFMNRSAEALTGWRSEEALSRPLAEVFRLVDEETGAPVADPSAEVLHTTTPRMRENGIRLVARDGSERPIDDTLAPILDEQSKQVGCVLVFRDASQRRDNERALLDADRRKDEFVAMLAHELHNPLAPLRNGVHILQNPAADAPTRGRVMKMMVRQIENMTRMIDDLLDVSRITRGKIELRREPLDFVALVERVAEVFRPGFETARRTLTLDLPAHPIQLDADPTRLEQVVGNLLGNALKYTRQQGHVWVSLEIDGGDVLMRVRDDGIGISAEMRPKIFDLFMQADHSLTRSGGGLGIGLTLVRTLVEMHGGSVSVDSEGPGRGSEFCVRLPRSTRDLGAGAWATTPPPSPESAALRILVVDDNADSAESLAVLLGLRGHEVHTAQDGAAAISIASTLVPQLVLLDIGLPGIDGYEVARRLRETCSGGEAMVLVAVTGYGRPEDVQRALAAGFDHHLMKPVDLVSLMAVVQQGRRSSAAI